MVVYHGTCASGFTRFDPTKTREMGFHFGTPSQAKDFVKGCGMFRGRNAGVYPVYLSIQNPLFTPDAFSEDPVYFIEWLEETNHIHDWFPDESDSYYQSLSKMRQQLVETRMLPGREGYEVMKPLLKKIWGLLRKIVMRKGYDGIRYKNENEGNTDDASNIAWIAFSPAQVKSATENRGTFDRRDPDLRNPYTQPDLRERLKKRIMAGDKGGLPGEWSARKAQLLAAEYEKAGGGYTGNRSASQRLLSRWTRQDWRTKSGKPSLETGERYLPAAAIAALSSAEYAETSRAKRQATGQFSRQPKRIAKKTAEYRNPMIRTKLSRIIEPGDRVLDYDRAKGEELYRLWDLIHTDMPLTEEALTEIEGMLDDDGVLVIQSGEEPSGLRKHFRRATRYDGMLLVQGPLRPEEARINTEKLRRDLE